MLERCVRPAVPRRRSLRRIDRALDALAPRLDGRAGGTCPHAGERSICASTRSTTSSRSFATRRPACSRRCTSLRPPITGPSRRSSGSTARRRYGYVRAPRGARCSHEAPRLFRGARRRRRSIAAPSLRPPRRLFAPEPLSLECRVAPVAAAPPPSRRASGHESPAPRAGEARPRPSASDRRRLARPPRAPTEPAGPSPSGRPPAGRPRAASPRRGGSAAPSRGRRAGRLGPCARLRRRPQARRDPPPSEPPAPRLRRASGSPRPEPRLQQRDRPKARRRRGQRRRPPRSRRRGRPVAGAAPTGRPRAAPPPARAGRGPRPRPGRVAARAARTAAVAQVHIGTIEVTVVPPPAPEPAPAPSAPPGAAAPRARSTSSARPRRLRARGSGSRRGRPVILDLSAVTDALIDLVRSSWASAPIWAELGVGQPDLHADVHRPRARTRSATPTARSSACSSTTSRATMPRSRTFWSPQMLSSPGPAGALPAARARPLLPAERVLEASYAEEQQAMSVALRIFHANAVVRSDLEPRPRPGSSL